MPLLYVLVGMARLVSESRHDSHHVPWILPPGISQSQLGGIFKLDWLHKLVCTSLLLLLHFIFLFLSICMWYRGAVEFSVCMDLKNPWNDNKPVKISRDGQVCIECLMQTGTVIFYKNCSFKF